MGNTMRKLNAWKTFCIDAPEATGVAINARLLIGARARGLYGLDIVHKEPSQEAF